jgi:LPS sulfotransferase NodH
MIKRKILVVGHPRTGTGYMSKLLSSTGLEIGHEWIGRDGMSCWMFATEDGNYTPGPRGDINGLSRKDFEFQHIIHLVKNPYTSMSSIVNVENAARLSYQFRKKYVYINDRGSRLEKAVQSFLGWHEMIERNIKTSCTINIENSQSQLKSFLAGINLPNDYKELPPTD